MKNNYWAERIDELNTLQCDKSIEEVEATLAKMYIQALERTKKDIVNLYNKISANEAPKLNDLYRYNRYFEMMGSLNRRLTLLGKKEIEVEEKSYVDLYNKVQDTISKEAPSIVSNTELMNANAADVVKSIWCADGRLWSDRIWQHKQELQDMLEKGLVDCVARGAGVDEVAREIDNAFKVGFNQATRIVRTELAHIQNQATLDRYIEAGFKYFRIVAIHDDLSCEGECHDLDGKIFPIERMVAGDMLPPFHPNCRCSFFPVYKEA